MDDLCRGGKSSEGGMDSLNPFPAPGSGSKFPNIRPICSAIASKGTGSMSHFLDQVSGSTLSLTLLSQSHPHHPSNPAKISPPQRPHPSHTHSLASGHHHGHTHPIQSHRNLTSMKTTPFSSILTGISPLPHHSQSICTTSPPMDAR